MPKLLDDDLRRGDQIFCRVNPIEHKAVMVYAKKAGMNKSDYLRFALRNQIERDSKIDKGK